MMWLGIGIAVMGIWGAVGFCSTKMDGDTLATIAGLATIATFLVMLMVLAGQH